MGNIETKTKFSKLKIIILLLYSDVFVFKCLFTITKENYKKYEFLKGFFNLFVFGFLFIKKNYDRL